MKLLELFSGTKSASKVLIQLYPDLESVSLDFCPKYQPDILIDILEWDYTFYPRNYFDIVWASPNCKEYSRARFGEKKERNFEYADSLVKRTLEIITYFDPKYWFLENPKTGLLKTRPFMADLPFVDVDYCRYGKEMQKPTRFWTNLENFKGKKCQKLCGQIVKVVDGDKIRNLHKGRIGDRKTERLIKHQFGYKLIDTYEYRISIPEKLLCEIFLLI